MATIEIAYSDYVRNVRCNAHAAAVLAARLLKAAPPDLPPEIAAALRDVDAAADHVAAVQSDRDRVGPAKLRLMRAAFANGWGAMHEALLATSRIPARVSDRGERGAAILGSVFPDGVTFVLLESDAAWSEGVRRVERLAAEGFKPMLDDLIGADFVSTVERVTRDLGDAIGVGPRAHIVRGTTALQEALGQFSRKVGRYGRLMVGTCDEDDPASLERFLRAMQPIDAHRSSVRSNVGDDDGQARPGMPGPPVTNGTPTPTPPVGSPSPFIDGN